MANKVSLYSQYCFVLSEEWTEPIFIVCVSTRLPHSWRAPVIKVGNDLQNHTLHSFLGMNSFFTLTGTVHIFSLDGATPSNSNSSGQQQSQHSGHDSEALTTSSSSSANNTKSGLSFVRDMLPQGLVPKYFGSEWSFAQVRGLEGKCICAFDRDSPKITVNIQYF